VCGVCVAVVGEEDIEEATAAGGGDAVPAQGGPVGRDCVLWMYIEMRVADYICDLFN
jgi:hypothetical protein